MYRGGGRNRFMWWAESDQCFVFCVVSACTVHAMSFFKCTESLSYPGNVLKCKNYISNLLFPVKAVI